MSLAKDKPLYAVPTDYEDDFYAWSVEQAELLRLRRFSELDLTNLVEEIESMGREQRHALRSSYRVLLIHLLKWQFQPDRRSRSWSITIVRERGNIAEREEDNPSLKSDAKAIVVQAYRTARADAAAETGLDRATFPAECPYAIDDLRNSEFLPD